MNSPLVNLLADLHSRGVAIGTQDGLIWYEPKSSVDADLLERIRLHKAALLTALTADLVDSQRAGDISAEANEFYWRQIEPAERQYLLGARHWPEACPWCGGRQHHSTMCDELHERWAIRLNFGKHKGKRIQDVPRDYLRWLLGARTISDRDLRRGIRRLLEREDNEQQEGYG
jgi:hypothetical protein